LKVIGYWVPRLNNESDRGPDDEATVSSVRIYFHEEIILMWLHGTLVLEMFINEPL
jgi:hypothetical protein